jgi:hypothetical protein
MSVILLKIKNQTGEAIFPATRLGKFRPRIFDALPFGRLWYVESNATLIALSQNLYAHVGWQVALSIVCAVSAERGKLVPTLILFSQSTPSTNAGINIHIHADSLV